MKKSTRNSIYIVLMLLVSAALISLALPSRDKKTLVYAQGKPWHYEMLTAPFDIPIEYDSVTARHIADSIAANFVKIYSRDNSVATAQIKRLQQASSEHHEIPLVMRQHMLNAVAKVYDDGIVDNTTFQAISDGSMPQVRILTDNVAQTVSTQSMRSVRQAYVYLDSTLAGVDYHDAMSKMQLSSYLAPNVLLDSVENSKLLESAVNAAMAPIGVVQTGESIIYSGNIVTTQKYMVLKKYEEMMRERNMDVVSGEYYIYGQIALIVMLLICFYMFMRFYRPRTFHDLRSMVFLISYITLFTVFTYIIVSFRPNLQFAIPFGLVSIVLITFYDSRLAFFVHMVVLFLCSLVVREPWDFLMMQFFTALIAIAAVQELTRRSQIVRCAFLIFLSYCLSFLALVVAHSGTIKGFNWHPFGYFAFNCIVLSFAYVLIFIVEKIFGFTSSVTLVELSDINNPVLRELSEHCPGTFQHSLQVANLASEAAHRIGANMQLARAGALYHDIGKIDNPAFFTENQVGVNPHDVLTPEQSARIVIEHVTNGLKRADKAKLPQSIKDFISQHHGHGVTRYFYTMACKASPTGQVDPAPFTYPGPNPQSKVTAIVMMADSCEAASKSLKQYDEKTIETLVNRIIDGQIAQGLLKDTALSFRDVEIIKRTFIEMLRTFYHARVSYPDDIAPKVAASATETAKTTETDKAADAETAKATDTANEGSKADSTDKTAESDKEPQTDTPQQ